MLQREVAERVAAAPGDMSYLSVFVQYHAKARVAFRVPREAFEPAPKVESAVLVLEPFPPDDRLDAAAEEALWRVVQAGFRERRKMLHNVLSRQLPDRARAGRRRARCRRDRPRPAAADRRGGGVDRAHRGPRPHPRRPMTMPATDADRRLAPVIRLAPAKVNLTLAVLGTRADGFHDLHSVMVPLDLADRLSVSVLPPGSPDSLHVEGFDPGPPAGNLVLRAITVARRHAASATGTPDRLAPLAARLDKRIPVAAGLAGGSSDAAATVDAALEAWGVDADVEPDARRRIAAELGSDVPFFLAGGPALVEGRGERVTPLGWLRDAGDGERRRSSRAARRHARRGHLDAGGVRGLRRRRHGWWAEPRARHRSTSPTSCEPGLRVVDLLARAGVLAAANDLAPAAAVVEPGLVPFKRALLRLLGRPVGLSGSGPTHWALYPSIDEAATAADQVREAFAEGRVPTPGGRAPFVAAARIVAPREDDRRQA